MRNGIYFRPGRVRPSVRRRRRRAVLVSGLLLVAVLGAASLYTWVWAPRQASARAAPRSSAVAQAVSTPGTASTAGPPGPVAVIPLGRSRIEVPILEYHYVRVDSNPADRLGFNLSVTPADFGQQMDWLAGHDYHPVHVADLVAYFRGQRPLPARAVVLTFDDGYLDFYTTAAATLRRHDFTAVSYIVPGFVGRQGYMSREQVAQLDGEGFEIASHTVHHSDLTRASPANLNVEVQASRGYLEQLVGHPVLDFCYPSGKYNALVEAAVARAGYDTATTEVPGTAHTWADRLAWTRVRINGGEKLADFVRNLGQPEPSVLVTPAPPAKKTG